MSELNGRHGVATGAEGFNHSVFVHRGEEEYLRGVRAFLERGQRAGEPVVVVVPTERLELLQEHLGREADALNLLDMRILGRNPARLLPRFVELVKAQRGQRMWFVGEPVWAERSPEEIDEAIIHEAMSNIALAGFPINGFCPYDAGSLDPRVIAAAKATHPLVSDGLASAPNLDYHTNGRWPAVMNPLADPAPDAARLPFAASDLDLVRRTVDERAAAAGLDQDRRCDVVLAVNEIATNSVMYAGSGGELRLWSSSGHFVCEISDPGLIEDPLSGRRQPEPAALSGRGLWLANHLCELVQIRTGNDGTTIRVMVPING